MLRKFLTSFSVGYLGGCRRTLQRLTAWLETNSLLDVCPGFACSSGVLCWFVEDEQAKTRSPGGGLSIPNSLRAGLLFAAEKLKLSLDVRAEALENLCKAPAKTPVPALSVSFKILLHFATLSRSANV